MSKLTTDAPRERQGGGPMWRRALALWLVFGSAKIAVIALVVVDGRGGALASPFTPLVLAFQDLWVAALYLAVELALGVALRRSVSRHALFERYLPWALYAVLAGYAAVNVPVTRIFSTPLTYALVAATGGALSDSIRLYLTPLNVASVLVPLASAATFPKILVRVNCRRAIVWGLLPAIAAMASGPLALRRVSTRGLHRNAVAAIALTTWARRAGGQAANADWYAVPLPIEGAANPLVRLRGSAAGHNVIWVILESTGARYLRLYGAERDATPHLTALGARGVVFDNVYAAYPESIKGLYSILCAAYPGPGTSPEQYVESVLPGACIAERFQAAGYRTGLFHSGRFAYLGMSSVIANRGFERLEDAATIGGQYASSFGTDDASTARRVLSFIDDAGGAPFLAFYMPISGHHPYQAPGNGPRPFAEADDRDRYLNDLYAGDDAFGALVDGVRARGLLGKTTWIVNGDHGEAFAQHEGNFAHSLYVYEENVHVPFIVVVPGVTDSGERAPQLGSLIDAAPTLLDLVGLPIPERYHGRSLIGLPPMVARFFTDYTSLFLGMRHGNWKFIYDVEAGRPALFDLSRDPAEEHDLSDRFPERVSLYEGHLKAWSSAQRARITAR